MRFTERQFVEMLRQQAALWKPEGDSSRLRRGIGDDCAVIAGTGQKDWLVTTDLFIEKIHFRREWQPAASVGYKALARCLSDIAAMGGTPRYAFLSLALPPEIEARWVRGFVRGFLQIAQSAKVALAGGDTAASPGGVMADVVLVGEVERGQAVLRRGASPGDEIWVTGVLGRAADGLAVLRAGSKRQKHQAILRPLFYPQPRIAIGQYLRRKKLASAMIDLSDGLSIDLARLCEQSGVGARIAADAIPRSIQRSGQTSLQHALHGGEDLELLFTVSAKRSATLPRHIGGVRLTRIGEILPGRKLLLLQGKMESPLPIRGFQHF
ncbi:MAG: thiamine-phosphate kinase [Acidobacteria bacterium]|nr:thiamine-phosphate kinase [Acidobacteriota bacterium]